jgi:hypothetical protein
MIMPQMYCLSCFYDLRGLPEHRCPECGRAFSPHNPATFSPVPHKERFNKLVKQASALLSDALGAIEPGDPATRATADLRRQIRSLAVENAELRQKVVALTELLIDRKVIDASELAAAITQLKIGNGEIIDDTDDSPTDETETATVELIELKQAVDDREQA